MSIAQAPEFAPLATALLFDFERPVEQFEGRQGRFDDDGAVEKLALPARSSRRRGRLPSAERDDAHRATRSQSLDGAVQIRGPVALIRAERQQCTGHDSHSMPRGAIKRAVSVQPRTARLHLLPTNPCWMKLRQKWWGRPPIRD